MWWISYRGEGKHGLDNIGVFNDDGTVRKDHPLLLDPSPKAHPLHIPRGFALVGDDLYIASAWRRDSHVARYRRRGNSFHYADNLVTSKQAVAMVHPFDVELGDDGRLYISCQDTNTVIAILPKSRKPAPVAPHLREAFPEGTVSPRHRGGIGRRASAGRGSHAACRMFLRRKDSKSCSTCTANRATRCAASSCTGSTCTSPTKQVTRSRSSRSRRAAWWRAFTASGSRNPCTSSCTARRCTSARPAPAASSPTTSRRNHRTAS